MVDLAQLSVFNRRLYVHRDRAHLTHRTRVNGSAVLTMGQACLGKIDSKKEERRQKGSWIKESYDSSRAKEQPLDSA